MHQILRTTKNTVSRGASKIEKAWLRKNLGCAIYRGPL